MSYIFSEEIFVGINYKALQAMRVYFVFTIPVVSFIIYGKLYLRIFFLKFIFSFGSLYIFRCVPRIWIYVKFGHFVASRLFTSSL